MGMQTADKVRFNVRGKIFETTATTLASAGRNSMFGAMFDEEWNLQPRETNKEEYFIDRNPDCFSVFLDLLGTGALYVPPNIPENLLYREAQYYGILDHVRAAKLGQFDSNRLRLTSTVTGQQAPHSYTAIRASPDGGCAVSHGGIVRLYDWMLEEHQPINLNYQRVGDIGWIDSENIAIGVFPRLSQPLGSVGLFSVSTGALKHRFQLNHENLAKGFNAKALCLNSDSKIFATCQGTSNGGIGVWDQVTGKQIDFFDFFDSYTGVAEKIEWLNGSNCLFTWKKNGSISLLDFRDKSIVWSRSMNDAKTSGYRYVVDATPMDDRNSICVLSFYEDLGFVDFRSTNVGTRWNSNKKDAPDIYCPKLTYHGGRLFCSMNEKISVYHDSLDEWFLTSTLGRSQGGKIQDFSIGGDRLFALHGEENVFDVWETPASAPIAREWSSLSCEVDTSSM